MTTPADTDKSGLDLIQDDVVNQVHLTATHTQQLQDTFVALQDLQAQIQPFQPVVQALANQQTALARQQAEVLLQLLRRDFLRVLPRPAAPVLLCQALQQGIALHRSTPMTRRTDNHKSKAAQAAFDRATPATTTAAVIPDDPAQWPDVLSNCEKGSLVTKGHVQKRNGTFLEHLQAIQSKAMSHAAIYCNPTHTYSTVQHRLHHQGMLYYFHYSFLHCCFQILIHCLSHLFSGHSCFSLPPLTQR